MEPDRQLERKSLLLRCGFDTEQLADAHQPVTQGRDVEAHCIGAGLNAAPGFKVSGQRVHICRAVLGVMPYDGADAAFDEKLDLACLGSSEEQWERTEILRRQRAMSPEAAGKGRNPLAPLPGYRIVVQSSSKANLDEDWLFAEHPRAFIEDIANEWIRSIGPCRLARGYMANDRVLHGDDAPVAVVLANDARD